MDVAHPGNGVRERDGDPCAEHRVKPIIVRCTACGSELEFKSMFVKEQKPKPEWLLVCLSCGEIFKTPADRDADQRH
jgi:uncharacterized Zn finger protein